MGAYTAYCDRSVVCARCFVCARRVGFLLVNRSTPAHILAYFRDIFVGVVGARLENSAAPSSASNPTPPALTGSGGPADASYPRVYITVLAVLAPYRGRGIGGALLRAVLNGIDARETPLPVALHVNEGKDGEGLVEFYARFGFAVTGRVENYYRRLDSPHALLLMRPAAAKK